jgi:hypothetical protein
LIDSRAFVKAEAWSALALPDRTEGLALPI